MNELLKYIVINTKVNNKVIQTRIVHPITQKKYPNRTVYVLLKKYVDDFFKIGSEPRLIGLAGLRGTGKTTLMWQIADYIYSNQREIPIYFFNVNEIQTAGYSLYQILKAFEKFVLKKSFREFNTPFVLLFDEVHDDPDWARTLKILYDDAKTAFIICTGSSALLLQSTEDLARRMRIEKVYPFRFIEFITAKSFFEKDKIIFPQKSLASNLKQIFFYSNSVDELYRSLLNKKEIIQEYYEEINTVFNNEEKDLVSEYIKYHNIPAFIVYKEKSLILDSMIDLFSRVIDQDIKKLGNHISVSSNKILKLLLQLALSDEINFDILSQKTGIKKTEIEGIMDLLEKAELINILNPYGGGETRIWKNKKVFFMSPSLRFALLSIIYRIDLPNKWFSKLYEDVVAMYLVKTLNDGIVSIAKQTKSTTPDFIIETLDKPLAIEVGISKTTTDQFSKIDCRYGILISNKIEDILINNNYLKLPLKWFLLI